MTKPTSIVYSKSGGIICPPVVLEELGWQDKQKVSDVEAQIVSRATRAFLKAKNALNKLFK